MSMKTPHKVQPVAVAKPLAMAARQAYFTSPSMTPRLVWNRIWGLAIVQKRSCAGAESQGCRTRICRGRHCLMLHRERYSEECFSIRIIITTASVTACLLWPKILLYIF
jgi:hypothetical protein